MQALPHQYTAKAIASSSSTVTTKIDNIADLEMAAPANFGGPGDLISPEDLQTAAVASCLILSFRAIARASKLEWEALEVEVNGTLEQVERVVQFTEFHTVARLSLPAGSGRDKAVRILEKADKSCLITNSLKAQSHLEIEIEGGD